MPLNKKVELRPIPMPGARDWQGAMADAPRTLDEAAELLEQLPTFWNASTKKPVLVSEVFLQVWRMGFAKAGPRYAENIQRWLPIASFGVWPGRRPPQRATLEIAMDCAAAVLTNQEQPLAAHAVSRVSAGREAAQHAFETMFGLGMTVQMLFPSTEAADTFSATSIEIFLPNIADPAFRHERFYLPLFDIALLKTATDAELDDWMCGANGYLRESPEDQSVLLVFKSSGRTQTLNEQSVGS